MENPAIYDEVTETLTIYGIKYSVDVFSGLAFAPIGATFRIVGRADSIATLESLREPKQ